MCLINSYLAFGFFYDAIAILLGVSPQNFRRHFKKISIFQILNFIIILQLPKSFQSLPIPGKIISK